MLDPLFFERLKNIFRDDYESVIESLSVDRLSCVRVNTLVVDVQRGFLFLQDNGFSPRAVFDSQNMFLLQSRTKRDLTDTDEYKQGWFYIQSPSSMLPVIAISREVMSKVELDAHYSVLDMCAAPGSKTSQLAAVMQNSGRIIALDVSRQRSYMLKSNLESQHVTNVELQLGNSSYVWKKYGPVFDLVMLDAPCSGEGRLSLSDESLHDDWSLRKIRRLQEEQKRLIFSAIMCLKSGGALVYSTCTFAPEENESVLQFALDTFQGAISIESIRFPFNSQSFVSGLREWNGSHFSSDVSSALRVKPDAVWDGFFVCVVRRM